MNIIESKLLKKMAFLNELKRCSEIEIAYLKGDYTSLPNGDQFKVSTHPYALDLDIFGDNSLYQSVNRTITKGGTDTLCQWLLFPCKSKEEIIERQQAVTELRHEPDWCHAFRAIGRQHSLLEDLSERVTAWQKENNKVFGKSTLIFLYLLPIITITGWILSIFSIISITLPVFLSLIQLIVVVLYQKEIQHTHRQLDLFLRSFSNLYELIRHLSHKECHSKRLLYLHEKLFSKDQNAHEASRALYKILEGLDQRGNLLGALIMNGLYMRDLNLLVRVVRWKSRYAVAIPSWTEAVYELDALVSLANYNYNHASYIFPSPDSTHLLQGKAIGHPLIPSEQCVTNDLQVEHLHEFYIITGANMAGKSTFLRSIGVNLVLAHAGSVVNAKSFEFQPMALFSSMRTADNLAKGTSYFHAELLRLKQLIETAQQEDKLFIILDEILKGTNSVDKLNGSRRFLQKLVTLPIAGLIATHDLELGKLAETYPDNFINNCFEITHTDDDIAYDYKLKPGISQNMNASILLEKMGLV